MKQYFITIILILICLISISQKINLKKNSFKFENLTFHSVPHIGADPDISLNIYSDKKVEFVKTVYITENQIDTTLSGAFKGVLNYKDYNRLITLLKNCDLDSLESLSNVLCCGGPIKILIVSYNGKYKRFKFKTTSSNIDSLINFLTQLSIKVPVIKYNGAIDFEE